MNSTGSPSRIAALQQAVGLDRRGRRDDHEPRHVDEPGFEALRVLRGGAAGGTGLRAHDQRNGELAARHVAVLRGLIDQAIHRQRGEVDEHDLEHGPQPTQRRAGGNAGDRRFADGGVAHAGRAVFLRQAAGHAESPAGRDILAQADAPQASRVISSSSARRRISMKVWLGMRAQPEIACSEGER